MTPSLSLKRLGLTALAVLLIVAPLIMPGADAAPQLVSWGNPQVRSITDSLTDTYSAIDYDSSGKIHISWLEYGTSGSSRLLYTNNVTGSWLSPVSITTNAATGSEPLLDMKVQGNQVHFLYILTSTGQVAHRVATLSGGLPVTSGATSLSGGAKGANPELVIDNTNTVHAFYITRSGDTAPYQVAHRRFVNGSWIGGFPVDPTGVQQKFPNAVVTSDGNVHLAFMNNGDTFRYYIYNGGAWQQSTAIFSGKAKQLHLSANGNTVYALYTAQPGDFHNLYFRQGGNGVWSNPELLSSGASYDENPFGYYNQPRNTFFAFWMSGTSTEDTQLAVREYIPNTSFSPRLLLGGVKVQYPRAAGNAESVSVIWQDKVSGTYDIRMRTTGTSTTPTPTSIVPPTAVPTAVPTVSPVDFTLNRTGTTPTKDPNVPVGISNPVGSPNQMRYSLTPFAANNSALAWQTLQTAFTVNTGAGSPTCRLDIFVQVRNSVNGQYSSVKSFGVVVDTTIQSVASMFTIENSPAAQRPAAQRPADINGEQPYAPSAGDPNYTRSTVFGYNFTQEASPCTGIKSYQIETYGLSPSPMPNPMSGFAPFNPFNSDADSNGVGFPEQTVTANLVLTDTLGTKADYTKTIFYDDDPPVLAQGGSISFPKGVTSTLSIVPIQFVATVTDDGYTNSAPADKKYWGLWVVATKSQAMPEPIVFAQYGKVHQITAGGNSLEGINLTNDYDQETPLPAMRTAGERYIHIRFLDGAGNYTATGLTSPAITLNEPFIDGTNTYLPVVAN